MRATEDVLKKREKILADLDSVTETEVAHDGKRFLLRSARRFVTTLPLCATGPCVSGAGESFGNCEHSRRLRPSWINSTIQIVSNGKRADWEAYSHVGRHGFAGGGRTPQPALCRRPGILRSVSNGSTRTHDWRSGHRALVEAPDLWAEELPGPRNRYRFAEIQPLPGRNSSHTMAIPTDPTTPIRRGANGSSLRPRRTPQSPGGFPSFVMPILHSDSESCCRSLLRTINPRAS